MMFYNYFRKCRTKYHVFTVHIKIFFKKLLVKFASYMSFDQIIIILVLIYFSILYMLCSQGGMFGLEEVHYEQECDSKK